MKRIAFATSVVVLVLAVAVQAQTPAQTKSGGVEQELIKLENDWAVAAVKLDVAFFERIYADDFIFTDTDGNVSTKAQQIAILKPGGDVATSAVVDELKVRVYGDAAVVTGRWTSKETIKGTDISGQYRYTDTWVKLAGRWQCVAEHSSKIPQK
jgi:ketosteroid isomerase-like protein